MLIKNLMMMIMMMTSMVSSTFFSGRQIFCLSLRKPIKTVNSLCFSHKLMAHKDSVLITVLPVVSRKQVKDICFASAFAGILLIMSSIYALALFCDNAWVGHSIE